MGLVQNKFWAFAFVSGVVVFSIILYFLFSARDEKISASVIPQVSREGEVTVYASDKGFNPENITIKSGTQIKWINNGSYKHSVMFTLSTSLDNLAAINEYLEPGETLSFKFENAGEYSYVDKTANFVGKVNVK